MIECGFDNEVVGKVLFFYGDDKIVEKCWRKKIKMKFVINLLIVMYGLIGLCVFVWVFNR